MRKLATVLILFPIVVLLLNGCTQSVEDGLPGKASNTSANTYHPAGWKDNPQHGVDYSANQQYCRACHGNNLQGGSSGVSCVACHHGWSGTHGEAYTSDPDNCKACHGADLTGGLIAPSCLYCHHYNDWDDTHHGVKYDATSDTCKGCHGADLTGGGSGLSCVGCHDDNLHHTGGEELSCDTPACHAGGGGGQGCDECHGHDAGFGGATGGAGTVQSHSIHTENDDSDELKGPNTACSSCHNTNSYPNFADGQTTLAATTVCDNCHSKLGAVDGVTTAKANWDNGVYEADGTLKAGFGSWCISCHDDVPAYSKAVIGGGVYAPNKAGDNTTYGYNVTGHGTTGAYNATLHGQNGPGFACTVCHDTTLSHISGTLDDSDRLETVADDGLAYTSDISEVCLDCHKVGQSAIGGLGYDATAEATVHSGAVSGNYNTNADDAFPAYGESADYATNPGYQCGDCHDVHGTEKLAMVLATIDGNVGDTSNPVSVDGFESTDTDLTDLDPSAAADNGVCDVCHTSGGGDPHPDTNHAGNHHQGDTGNSCMACHLHTSSFFHGSASFGSGCEPCHGNDAGLAGTYFSHSTHTESDADDLKGPDVACDACHDTDNYPYFKSGTGDAPYDLAETDVCDTCHSAGGAFDGVGDLDPENPENPVNADSEAFGAKYNWKNGVYTGDALTAGKEDWCAGCHDDVPSVIETISAPKVMGDDAIYGFNVSGHGRAGADKLCLDCHDSTKNHIDGDARTYVYTSDNYNQGYRLKYTMNIPLWSADGSGASNFDLCFSCHTYDNIFDNTTPFNTNFRDDTDAVGHSVNRHASSHLGAGEDPRKPSSWDSDWDGATDSRISCPACHNVHGSKSPRLIRSGELISTPGTTDKVPALDFRWYKNDGTTQTTVFSESYYGDVPPMGGPGPGSISDSKVCNGCHAGGGSIKYYRTPTN